MLGWSCWGYSIWPTSPGQKLQATSRPHRSPFFGRRSRVPDDLGRLSRQMFGRGLGQQRRETAEPRVAELSRKTSGFFRDDLAVLPEIDGTAVHARALAAGFCCAAHSAADARGEALRLFWSFALGCHGPRSRSCGVNSELS